MSESSTKAVGMDFEDKNIYVVDDDPLVRQTVVNVLESENFEVRSFECGQDFLSAAASLAPGCVLLDVQMPDMDGLEVLEKLDEKKLSFPIVMISGYGDISTAVKALRNGAVDFVEKPFSPEQLLEAIRSARETNRVPELKDTPLSVVTSRELEVIKHLVEGDPNKVVAYKLGISERTVEVHRAKIMSRLEVGTFAELVRMAVKSGL